MLSFALLLNSAFTFLIVQSKYVLLDNYMEKGKFADKFNFQAIKDPFGAYVEYLTRNDAVEQGLFKESFDGSVYIGVDSKNKVEDGRPGRKTVLLQSVKDYKDGLFVVDIAHAPASICSTWPMFILWGAVENWPGCGQINIIEGVNTNKNNTMSLNTDEGCQITNSSTEYTGKLLKSNCYIKAPGQKINRGCQILADGNDNYGEGFNKANGGVYATEITSEYISIWHFPRLKIPEDLKYGGLNPNPESWGTPTAKFCGDFPSSEWVEDCDFYDQLTCRNFVRDNYRVFNDSYWIINSLKVFTNQSPTQTSSPSTQSTQKATTYFDTNTKSKSSTLIIKPGPTKKPSTPNPSASLSKKPSTQNPSAPLSKSSQKLGLYIGIPLSIITFIVVICLLVWCHHKYRNKRRKNTIYALMGNLLKRIGTRHAQRASTDLWEIDSQNLLIYYEKVLGKGAFGEIYLGQLIGDAGIRHVYKNVIALTQFHDCEVAIKMLPKDANDLAREDFQKELDFMKSLKYHPHLTCLLGYVYDSKNPLLVLQYCVNGNLLDYVIKQNKQIEQNDTEKIDLQIKQFLKFSWQIADGLNYFTSLGYIHRDIAARNILLDQHLIGDFGLCRTLENNEIYVSRGGRVPLRWLALECLNAKEYSVKSDLVVWHFTARIVYCWLLNPADRPNFADICQFFSQILEAKNIPYGYVDAAGIIDVELGKMGFYINV
ncbi:Endo-1,3(4)-beta-glucanase [Aphelenchoides bicaudatus]|nr:Endo-1,3(4)-beta-glucanase [Aphelenchoides bicaudatus]